MQNLLSSKFLADRICAGSPGIFPTDTLPAIATIPGKAKQIWELKHRIKSKPLILMGHEAELLFKFIAQPILSDCYKVGERYWPGALTIIVPASGLIVKELNPLGNSIGLRVPACRSTLDLLSRTGPLATSSANISGKYPYLFPHQVSADFKNIPLLGPLPWPKNTITTGSTIVELYGSGKWKIHRQGTVIFNLSELNNYKYQD
uniref:Threonylcarbamoyl-AMP synthase n=1 Tax=Paulinella chromatophora TaxID=39717 RepID=B1X546_PAUCH|nr:Putative translation factor (SUA5) [Paulinella chromatophora]ACB43065.1 Putative translation factor (SUA5) [Paulinella chromatophora]